MDETEPRSHEEWHQHHLRLLRIVTENDWMRAMPCPPDNEELGNLGDDLWEWMRWDLGIAETVEHCDWCECPVAQAVESKLAVPT